MFGDSFKIILINIKSPSIMGLLTPVQRPLQSLYTELSEKDKNDIKFLFFTELFVCLGFLREFCLLLTQN